VLLYWQYRPLQLFWQFLLLALHHPGSGLLHREHLPPPPPAAVAASLEQQPVKVGSGNGAGVGYGVG